MNLLMDGLALRLSQRDDVPPLALMYAEGARLMGPQIYTAEQVAAWASFGADTPAFTDYVLGPRTWVAVNAAGEPQGFCGVASAPGTVGEVRSLYVRAALTRQGLGTRLLAHALADAQARGIAQFAAWVTPFSRPVFERAGFTLVDTVQAPFGDVMFERYRVQRG